MDNEGEQENCNGENTIYDENMILQHERDEIALGKVYN
jgi:hypothetical protein